MFEAYQERKFLLIQSQVCLFRNCQILQIVAVMFIYVSNGVR